MSREMRKIRKSDPEILLLEYDTSRLLFLKIPQLESNDNNNDKAMKEEGLKYLVSETELAVGILFGNGTSLS